MPRLHIVASCTDRKRLPPVVLLRDTRGPTIGKRYAAWRASLRSVETTKLPAAELYMGDHWKVVQSLAGVAAGRGWRPSLWITSAGYGLVQETKPLVPYSATFARGQRDSVAAGDNMNADEAEWWRLMTTGKAALGGSVAAVARGDRQGTILVLASPSYLNAMAADLEDARSELRGRGALLIVSSRAPEVAPSLRSCWVPSRATHRAEVGGALISLHARVARRLLLEIAPKDFTKENLCTMSDKLDQVGTGGAPRQARAPMSDEEVVRFIRDRLAADPKIGHTRLLRELRASGRACEQARFRRIFIETAGAR